MLIKKRIVDTRVYCTKYTWNKNNDLDFPLRMVNFFTDYNRYGTWGLPQRDTVVYDLYPTLTEDGLGEIEWELEGLEADNAGFTYFMYDSNVNLKLSGICTLHKGDGSPTEITPREYFNMDGDNRFIKYLVLIQIDYTDGISSEIITKNVFQGILSPDNIEMTESPDDSSDIYNLQLTGFNKEFKEWYDQCPMKSVSTDLIGTIGTCDNELFQIMIGANRFGVDYRLENGLHFIPMEEGLSNLFAGNIAMPTGNNIVFEDSIMGQGVLNPSPAVGETYKDLGYVFAVRPLIYSRPSLSSINIVGDWVCKSGVEAFDGLTRYQLLYELCIQMGWVFFFGLEDDMIDEGQALMKLNVMNRANVPETTDDIDYELALKWTIKSSLDVRFIDTILMEESELACTDRGYAVISNDNESPYLNGMSYVIVTNNFRLGWDTPLPEARPINDLNWDSMTTQPSGNNPTIFNQIFHDGVYPWRSVTRIQRIVWERDRFITFRVYYYTWSGGISGEAVRNYYDVTYETDSMLRLDFAKSAWAKLDTQNTIYTSTTSGVWRGNSYGTTSIARHYIYRGNVANSFIRIGIKRTSSTTDAYTAIQHYGQYVKTATFANNFQKFLQNLNTKVFEVDLQDIDLNFTHKKRILNYPYDSGENTYRVIKQKLNLEEGITTLTIQKIDEDA